MKPAPDVMAAIVAEVDAARAGAIATHVPVHDVDDVVQLVLLVAWRRSQKGGLPTDRKALRVWLFTTARRVASDRWDQSRRYEVVDELPEGVVDPIPYLEARDELRALRFPRYLRGVLTALALGDSIAEAIRATREPPGTIYTRIRAARAKLRRRPKR